MASFAEDAEGLDKAGWRQCSTFYPNAVVGNDKGLPEGAILIVLTQSCSVVGRSLERDPHMELAVAMPFDGKFKERSDEARGKNVRVFRVCLEKDGAPVPYDISINDRFNAPRDEFLKFAPDGPVCSADDTIRVANWVARYYNRTALPTLLVERMAAAGFQKTVDGLLRQQYEGDPLHEEVVAIYGLWEPDDEVGPYRFPIKFIGRSVDAADLLREVLKKTFDLPDPEAYIRIDGVDIAIEVSVYDQVTIQELDELRRLSEWDLLSGLAEQA